MSPNERDIARLGVRLFETPYVRAYALSFSLSLSCRLALAARCGVGVVVASRHTQRESGGFTGGTPGGVTGWPASPSPGGCNLLLRDPATYADLLSFSFMYPLVPLRPFFRVVPPLTIDRRYRSRVRLRRGAEALDPPFRVGKLNFTDDRRCAQGREI